MVTPIIHRLAQKVLYHIKVQFKNFLQLEVTFVIRMQKKQKISIKNLLQVVFTLTLTSQN